MKTLYIDQSTLTQGKRYTFLSEDIVASGSTFRVQSIAGFESVSTSSGQIVCIGELGGERSELRRTTNASADGYPSNTYKEIGLRDPLQFDHPSDTPVYIVDFNRIETQWAATVNGTKATLFAYPSNIRPDQLEMSQIESSATAGFYFTRFNETIGNTNSDWSDAIPYSGYDDNMVASIKKRAIDDLGEQIDGKVITHEFLNQSLWEARREYHNSPGKRPFRRKFNTVIGTALTGSYRIDLPTDVEGSQTAENMYGVRVGPNRNMDYYDKKEWDWDYRNIPHSYLLNAYSAGVSTDLYLNSVRDFADSGAVTVENSVISYSARGVSGGTLRISTHATDSVSAGSDVWQNVSYGLPTKFTIFADPGGSSYIYFNRPFETSYAGMNIYADYYRTLLGYDSDADTLDEPVYDFFVDFLMAKIRQRRSRGANDITEDPNFKMYQFKMKQALDKEVLETDIKLFPDVPPLGTYDDGYSS